MTKNMTRKGLALGAAFALVGSAFVAIPAQAAGEISLAVTSGTGNGSVLGDSFSVRATLGSLVPSSSNDQIKFHVANAAEATLAATVDGGTAPSAHSEGTQVAGDTANYAASDSSAAASFVVSGTSFTTSGSVAPTVALTYDRNQTLSLNTGAAASHNVVVTAFLDADGDGVKDEGEFASAPLTISFVKADEVTWTAAFETAPALADATVKGIVTNNKDINIAQFAGGVEFGLGTVAGTTYAAVTGTGTTVDAAGVFSVGTAVGTDGKVTLTPSSALVAGTYVAVAIGGTANAEISNEVLSVVGAATILDFTKEALTTGPNVKEATATTAYTVRTGTTSLTYTAQANSDDPGTKAAVAGLPVKVTITKSGTMATGSSITAGGKTLAATGTSIDFLVTTDSAGMVSVPVTTSGLVSTDSFTIALSAQGEAGANTVVTIADTVANAFAGLNVTGASGVMKVAAGSTYSLRYAAVDNFGQKLTGNYRVLLIESGANPDVAHTASLVDGVATFTLTDSTTVTESYSATLQLFNSATGAYATANSLAAVTDTPVVGASNAAAAITLTGTDNWASGGTPAGTAGLDALALNNKDLGTADTRLGQTAPAVGPDGTTNDAANNVVTLGGQVTDAAGVSTYSAVTLSAPGVMFVSGTVSSLGSITVHTSATGAYSGVKAYSNTAGKVTITATAGASSKTLEVTFAAAALTTGASLVITAPDNVLPGSTLAISAKLVDKWGNPVAATAAQGFKYSYTGPGIQVGTAPTAFGTDGVAKLGYLLGTNDSGSITVTFSYDGDNTASTTADNITRSKTIVIGASANKVAAFTKRNGDKIQIVSQGAAKVRFMLNGKRVATRSSLGTLNRTFDLVDGKNVIEIYVDGKRVLRRAATK
jgi:hypothetical protein